MRFECTGSGKCCTSHGEYGFVCLSREDRQRFAKHLQMRLSDFTRKYCEKNRWHLALKRRSEKTRLHVFKKAKAAECMKLVPRSAEHGLSGRK